MEMGLEVAAVMVPSARKAGFSERISEEEVRRLGVRELASKPLAFRDLGRTIRRVLDGGEGPGADALR